MSSDALVALHQLVVREGPESLRLHALMAVGRVVTGHEIVEIRALQWVRLQHEVLVRAEVVIHSFSVAARSPPARR